MRLTTQGLTATGAAVDVAASEAALSALGQQAIQHSRGLEATLLQVMSRKGLASRGWRVTRQTRSGFVWFGYNGKACCSDDSCLYLLALQAPALVSEYGDQLQQLLEQDFTLTGSTAVTDREGRARQGQ